MGMNRQFQPKMAKYHNRNISKTINPIKTKFEYQKTAILKNLYDVITPTRVVKFWWNLAGPGRMIRWWRKLGKSRKIESRSIITKWQQSIFQTGTSFISAVDWYISYTFGMPVDFHLLKQMQSLKQNPEVDFWLYGRKLKKIDMTS